MNWYQHKKYARGFTLIEVMLAITILATIMGIIAATTSSMFNTRELLSARYERMQMARNAMNRMSSEFAMAYIAGPDHGGEEIPGQLVGGNNAGGNNDEPIVRTQEQIQFAFIGKDDRVNFTAFAHVRTQPNEKASHNAEIGYYIRSERDAATGRIVRQLVRREDTTLDGDVTRGGVVYVMVPEVEDVTFEYWDTGAVKLGTVEEVAEGRWVKDWDTTRREFAGRLPTRVRITLELPPQEGQRDKEVFVTQTQVHVTEVLEF